MEVEADFLGINTALNLSLYDTHSPKLVLCNVPSFHTEGTTSLLYTLFEKTIPFCIHIAYMIFLLFIIAKGLAMCRLGGVISD